MKSKNFASFACRLTGLANFTCPSGSGKIYPIILSSTF
jgi:hypothetical protein